MRIRALIFLLFYLSGDPSVSTAQNADAALLKSVNTAKSDSTRPHLTSKLMNDEGILLLKFKDAWKYQQGDDLAWANPNFGDAAWRTLYPDGLSARAMPDSLWQGYGWWRLAFTADSALYQQVTRLHFRSWGAAEVYLDGNKISTYGNFSSQAATEKNFVPRFVIDKKMEILPASVHVLAVRFSNHQAKRNLALLKHNAPNLGFSIGLGNEAKGRESERNYAYGIASLSIISAILLLLCGLHLLLFFKFPKDNSNWVIALVIAAFFVSTMTNYAHLFIDMTGFRFALIRGFINSTFYGLGLVLLPYTLVLIFRLDKFKWTKHLIWLVLVRGCLYFFPILPIIISDSVFIIGIFTAIGFLMFQAIKSKKPSVHFITVSAISTTVFVLIDRLYATGVIHLSTEQFYIVLVFLFLSFPVGLFVYITRRYGSLFASMEQEVSSRTFELNQSLDSLKVSQVSLAAKNAENELLLKEIHHRVKNNLEVVSSLLELQSAQMEDPSVKTAMLSSQNRVQSMGIIHQKLYQGEHLASIEMRDYFVNLSESILDSFSADGRIRIECNMPKLVLDVDTAISIGLITNELITNSLKYAFKDKDKGEIKISLTEDKNDKNGIYTEGSLLLKISDDGIGKPVDSQAKGTGFGTQLINLLTIQLDGKLTYEVNNGTIVSLVFKKAKIG
jgi:two-component sensor histidine kinase